MNSCTIDTNIVTDKVDFTTSSAKRTRAQRPATVGNSSAPSVRTRTEPRAAHAGVSAANLSFRDRHTSGDSW